MTTALKIHSILVHDSKPVGVRTLINDSTFVDVELGVLKNISKEALKQLKVERLIPRGNLLVTEDELTKGYTVKDFSVNIEFCDDVTRTINAFSAKFKRTAQPTKKLLSDFDIVPDPSPNLANSETLSNLLYLDFHYMTAKIFSKLGFYLSLMGYDISKFNPKLKSDYANRGISADMYYMYFSVEVAKKGVTKPVTFGLANKVILGPAMGYSHNALNMSIILGEKNSMQLPTLDYAKFKDQMAFATNNYTDLDPFYETLALVFAIFMHKMNITNNELWYTKRKSYEDALWDAEYKRVISEAKSLLLKAQRNPNMSERTVSPKILNVLFEDPMLHW